MKLLSVNRLALVFLLWGVAFSALSQSSPGSKAVEAAVRFLGKTDTGSGGKKSVRPLSAANTPETRYRSRGNTPAALYVFQQNRRFVMVSETEDDAVVVGYCDNGVFDASGIPPQLKALMRIYEERQPVSHIGSASASSHTPVVGPLLDKAGIVVGQFNHPEADNCPSGCVATAVAQIMLYQSLKSGKPVKGVGSHCYTSITNYGLVKSVCGNFDGKIYTTANVQQLSLDLGIAMEMQYCGTPLGSTPALPIGQPLLAHFNHHVTKLDNYSLVSGRTNAVKLALDGGTPVYSAIGGDPEGHAFVVDGYDAEGYLHLNFGWGGNYNGYYLLNTGERFSDGGRIIFSSYLKDMSLIYNERIPVDDADANALRSINSSLGGYSVTGWDNSKPIDQWENIDIINGRVVGVSVNYSSDNVSVISSEIRRLTALRQLMIADQSNSGALKVNIGDIVGPLVNLEWLYLSDVLIDGSLSDQIAGMTHLEMVKITNVKSKGTLVGSLPHSVENLPDLKVFAVENQQLGGSVSAGLNRLVRLNSLSLKNNNLTGDIPVFDLPVLEYLDLSNNNLTGVAEGAWNLPALISLNFSGNSLTGVLPDGFGDFMALSCLDMSNNRIEGVSESFCLMPRLTTLNLANNNLGTLPQSLGKMKGLKSICLANNKLTSLPESVGYCTNLETVDCSSNHIEELPESVSDLHSLTTLHFQDNRLRRLPDKLGHRFTKVDYDFSNNMIERIPQGFENISEGYVNLSNNELRGKIPHSLFLIPDGRFFIGGNRFIYEDIPAAKDLVNRVGAQKPAMLAKKEFRVLAGDTLKIDIRDISGLSHPDNEYYWLVYPEYHPDTTGKDYSGTIGKQIDNNPVLTLAGNVLNTGRQYYCMVVNKNSPQYLLGVNNSWYHCLDLVVTENVSVSPTVADEIEAELLAEKYPDCHVVASGNIPGKTVSNHTVRLVAPLSTLRGTIYWQASADGNSWIDVDNKLGQNKLSENIVTCDDKELVLHPVTSAYYRCVRAESGCADNYSEAIKVEPLGKVLIDKLITDVDKPYAASADSIEVLLPAGLHDKPYRLTVTKVTAPPGAPDGLIMGSVYDLTVSFGSRFEVPIVIKLKNFDTESVNGNEIKRYRGAYFDEVSQKWVEYPNSALSLVDGSLIIETLHLTRIGWLSDPSAKAWGYTHKYIDKNITVYWDEERVAFLNSNYGRYYKDQPNPHPGVPFMVQDVVKFLDEARAAYKNRFGLFTEQAENNFYVYIKEMNNDGDIGVLGQSRGYLNLSDIIDSPRLLRTTVAHEFLHYLQGGYFMATHSAVFWAEANAILADRMVWDDGVVTKAEPEILMQRGTERYKNTIYGHLANSWDYWDHYSAGTFFGNLDHCYLAGCFLHYMRSYRPGTKLNPGEVLKQFPDAFYGVRWRSSLDQYIRSTLNSDIGIEYENYVKYLLGAGNEKFTVINPVSEHYPYRITMFTDKNGGNSFAQNIGYKFDKSDVDNGTLKEDKAEFKIPYMASKMVVLENSTPHDMVVVTYKRNHQAHADHRVYYGIYDSGKKAMQLVDISDADTYSFVLEPFQTSVKDKKSAAGYTACLLFINRECPDSGVTAADFDVSVDLRATPVMNIQNFGMLNVYSGSMLHKHNFDSGESAINFGVMNTSSLPASYPGRLVDYSSDKKVVNNNTLRSVATYRIVFDQGFVKGTSTVKDEIDYVQTVDYNFIDGTISVTEQISENRFVYPLYEYDNSLKDYVLVTPGYGYSHKNSVTTYNLNGLLNFSLPDDSPETEALRKYYGNHIKVCATSGSAETKSVISRINSVEDKTYYNKDGAVASTEHKHYINTDWSNSDLTLKAVIRLEPLK